MDFKKSNFIDFGSFYQGGKLFIDEIGGGDKKANRSREYKYWRFWPWPVNRSSSFAFSKT